MGNHDDRHALAFQPVQDPGKFQLEEIVDSFGGLIQKQDLRVGEKYFCKGRPLLLTTGKVVGMMFQKPGNIADW